MRDYFNPLVDPTCLVPSRTIELIAKQNGSSIDDVLSVLSNHTPPPGDVSCEEDTETEKGVLKTCIASVELAVVAPRTSWVAWLWRNSLGNPYLMSSYTLSGSFAIASFFSTRWVSVFRRTFFRNVFLTGTLLSCSAFFGIATYGMIVHRQRLINKASVALGTDGEIWTMGRTAHRLVLSPDNQLRAYGYTHAVTVPVEMKTVMWLLSEKFASAKVTESLTRGYHAAISQDALRCAYFSTRRDLLDCTVAYALQETQRRLIKDKLTSGNTEIGNVLPAELF